MCGARAWMIVAGVLLAGTGWADVVHLNSGARLEGKLTRADDGWVLTLDNGIEMPIPPEQIKRIELTPRGGDAPGGEATAQSRLNSLKKSVEALTDPRVAVERYEAFIRQYETTEAARAAREELARWRQRVEQGLVKQGDQWVTPARAGELQIEATAQSAKARLLMKAGQDGQALEVVQEALARDPGNVSALYLLGILRYRAEDTNAAKRAWEAVASQVPNHGPTLNNLAVVNWRQNRLMDALGFYDQAMSAQPADLIILSNVAEALNALPKDLRDGAVAQRVYRKYVEQDQVLQKRMAEQGLYRWGNQYVTREERERIEAQQKEIQGQLDVLARRFDELEGRIREIDVQGEQNDRTLRQLEASSWQRTWDGRLVRVPLPAVYFEIQRDNERLKQQRTQSVSELDRLRRQARELQQQLPRGQFTSVQQLIGVEGTPAVVPETAPAASGGMDAASPADQATTVAVDADAVQISVGPSTQPATQPAPR